MIPIKASVTADSVFSMHQNCKSRPVDRLLAAHRDCCADEPLHECVNKTKARAGGPLFVSSLTLFASLVLPSLYSTD